LLSSYLPRLNQKTILEVILQDMSKKILSTISDNGHGSKLSVNERVAVGGFASIISGFIGDDEYLEGQLVEWLTSTSGSYIANNLETRRAIVLVLAAKEGKSFSNLVHQVLTYPQRSFRNCWRGV
jgi:hypothetical protein